MYVAHPFLAQPADDDRLWRYMTPTVFLSMLLGRSIFFATLDSFEDPFEGVPPPAVLDAAREQERPDSNEATRGLDEWNKMIALCRATICASCWHVGGEESEAMWKLYGPFEDSLAIVTTLKSIASDSGDPCASRRCSRRRSEPGHGSRACSTKRAVRARRSCLP